MKKIALNKDLTDAGFSIIAERYQRISQYNNIGAQLLHKGGTVVCVEDGGADTTTWLLDKEEREAALKTPDIFLDYLVYEWADSDPDYQLSGYQWFPENIDHDFYEDDPCRVLVVGVYYGYEPIYWARYDFAPYGEIVFSSPGDATAWIKEQESSPYYLKHGEAGRPEYFIIS